MNDNCKLNLSCLISFLVVPFHNGSLPMMSWLYDQSNIPDSKVPEASMGPIWGQPDPGGPHVDPMEFAILGFCHPGGPHVGPMKFAILGSCHWTCMPFMVMSCMGYIWWLDFICGRMASYLPLGHINILQSRVSLQHSPFSTTHS